MRKSPAGKSSHDNAAMTTPSIHPDRAAPPPADIVIAHSSDLHVDDDYTARLYGGDGAAALDCVLAAARQAGADVTVLAGDVFEHNRLPLALIERAARLLAEAGTTVVVLPGNHDPATADSVYRRGGIARLPNVHILGVTDDDAVLFPGIDLEIWGHAHLDYVDMMPLRAPRRRRSQWQIAVAHGHYEVTPDRATRLRPSWLIDAAEVAATGADYVALGHWNRPAAVGGRGVPAYYSGSPDLAGTINVVRLKAGAPALVTRAPVRLPQPESRD
jgi:DNA repair exonuclease SbcCD nuclease subunit